MSAKNIRFFLIIFIISYVTNNIFGVIYDNRFFRVLNTPFARRNIPCTADELGPYTLRASRVRGEGFFLTASKAFGSDADIGIPEIFGPFNQRLLGEGIECLGLENPLPPELRDRNILWGIDGKLQGEGIEFMWDQHLYGYLYGGIYFFAAHIVSRQEFMLNEVSLQENEPIIAERALRRMFDLVGIESVKSSEIGFSDINCYLRVGNVWDYALKFRRIDAGLSLGVLIPSGVTRSISNPASIPFGGNGHWGVYGRIDTEFELKEDWIAGVWLLAIQRLKKTQLQRIPIKDEQPLYGAVVGRAEVDPGITVVFQPYVRLDHIRDGLGAMVQLFVIWHSKDAWRDARQDMNPPATFETNRQKSDWTVEYAKLNVFYDFDKVDIFTEIRPQFSFFWEIPVQYFASHGSVKTNRVGVSFQFNF